METDYAIEEVKDDHNIRLQISALVDKLLGDGADERIIFAQLAAVSARLAMMIYPVSPAEGAEMFKRFTVQAADCELEDYLDAKEEFARQQKNEADK